MKQLLCSITFSVFTSILVAQIPAGTKLIGGSAGFNRQKQHGFPNDQKQTYVSLSPSLGKAVKDNKVHGARIAFTYNHYEQSSGSKLTNYNAGVSLFKQQYVPLTRGFMLFGEGALGGNYGWQRDSKFRSYGVSAALGGGVAYTASKTLLVTLSIPTALGIHATYSSENSSPSPSITFRQSSFSAGITSVSSLNSIHAGVVFMF